MKAFLYKMKGAVALTLAMAVCCPQVYAATMTAEEQGLTPAETVVVEEEPLPQLTYEKALEMAKKNSLTLHGLYDQADMYHESRKDLQDMGVSTISPTYDYKKWVDDMWYAMDTAMFQLNLGLESNEINKQLENLKLELSVKTYFTTLASDQKNLEMMQKNAEIQQKLYVQGQTKRRLGMISGYALDELRIAAQQARATAANLEAVYEQNYTKFNQLLGGKSTDRYELVYDLTFEPYVMHQTMEQAINDKINNKDLSIKGLQLAVESAKFNMNYLAASSWDENKDQNEYNYDTAKRNLKSAKQNKETLIRNTYLQIQQMERQYESAQADVAKAAANYRIAQVNHQIGNVTTTTVELAELGLLQAENALEQVLATYDMLIFTFENPTLLADSSASAASGSY